MRIYNNENKRIEDYHLLHWSRHMPLPTTLPSSYYEPISISAEDSELVDCITASSFILKSQSESNKSFDGFKIYSYPFMPNDETYPKTLHENEEKSNYRFKVELICHCNGIKPKSFVFYYTYMNRVLKIGEKPDAKNLIEVKSCDEPEKCKGD